MRIRWNKKFKLFGSEKGVQNDQDSEAYKAGFNTELSKVGGVRETTGNKERGDPVMGRIVTEYCEKQVKRRDLFAEQLENPSNSVSTNRALTGRIDCLNQFTDEKKSIGV